jgi:NAD(P)-dependent dehydrogenase (short-subunit alcohol dehydrogenase family)
MSDHKSKKRVAAVTGATGAIGQAITEQLALYGYKVFLLVRDQKKSDLAVKKIRGKISNLDLETRLVDLSSESSILALAAEWQGPLHVLVNNAAISPRERLETPEGIEVQFATNVLGYLWMTHYFREILFDSAPARIVNVASYWAGGLEIDDLEFDKRPYHNHSAYRQSKQANRMLSAYYAEIFDPDLVTVNSCHPGDVNSNLSNSLGFGGSQSPLQGAETPSWLATSTDVTGITGKYFENKQAAYCPFSINLKEIERLYNVCSHYINDE